MKIISLTHHQRTKETPERRKDERMLVQRAISRGQMIHGGTGQMMIQGTKSSRHQRKRERGGPKEKSGCSFFSGDGA